MPSALNCSAYRHTTATHVFMLQRQNGGNIMQTNPAAKAKEPFACSVRMYLHCLLPSALLPTHAEDQEAEQPLEVLSPADKAGCMCTVDCNHQIQGQSMASQLLHQSYLVANRHHSRASAF